MIQLYENENQIYNDSIDKIVVELIKKKKDDNFAHLFLLTGCSTLSGTTSVSIAISIALANTNRKVLLVDCDTRKIPKYKKLNQNVEIGLSDFLIDDCAQKVDLDEIVYETNIDNLSYVPCGTCNKAYTRVMCSPKMKDLLMYSKTNFDYVIFDFPSISIVPDANVLLEEIDGVALLVALGETSKLQIKQTKRKILKYPDKYYGMIINKVEEREFKKLVDRYDYYFIGEDGKQNVRKFISKKIKID